MRDEVDIEGVLLGMMMRYPNSAIDDIREIVRPEDFSASTYRRVFDKICSLYDVGDQPDMLTVSLGLPDVSSAMLADWKSLAGTDSSPDIWARRVADEALRRRYVARAQDGIVQVRDAVDPREVAEDTTRELESYLDDGAKSEPDIKALCSIATDKVRENYRHPDTEAGYPLGMPTDVAHITRGIRPTWVGIVLAPTSFGKSCLMQQSAGEMANNNIGVLYLTLEMNAEETLYRIAAQLSRTHIRELEFPSCDDQLRRAEVVFDELAKLPIDIVYRPGLRLAELVPLVRRKVRKDKVRVVFVDYLNLLRVSNATDSLYRDVGEITSTLKQLAGQLGIAIIAGAQANRGGYGGAVKSEHVGESLKIVQDADLVIAIERDTDADGDLLTTGKLRVRKQRNGPQGWAPYDFHTGYLRFEETK